MTNGDLIRKMGDDDLMYMITRFFKDNKRCHMCRTGMDKQNRCMNPKADCEEEVYEWLGMEVENE